MAGVYIEGFEMPKLYGDYDATFCVDQDGKITVVWLCEFDPEIDDLCGKVNSVPDHGDLVDKSSLLKKHEIKTDCYGTPYITPEILFAKEVLNAPTIIPADRKRS